MKALALLLLLLGLAYGIPSNFDLRVQTEMLRFTRYELQPEGVCSGYAWAKEIAQVVSNAVGLYEQERLSLSAQQLLDCTESDTDVCYRASLDNIRAALAWLQKEGLTTQDCYPNRPFGYPHGFCRRECHDGAPFDFDYKVSVSRLSQLKEVVEVFRRDEKAAVLAVLKVDDRFNYYSPFSEELTAGGPSEESVLEYRVAEVLGWKEANSNPKVILRAGPGEQWGFNGYMDLDLEQYQGYVVEYYSIKLADTLAVFG